MMQFALIADTPLDVLSSFLYYPCSLCLDAFCIIFTFHTATSAGGLRGCTHTSALMSTTWLDPCPKKTLRIPTALTFHFPPTSIPVIALHVVWGLMFFFLGGGLWANLSRCSKSWRPTDSSLLTLTSLSPSSLLPWLPRLSGRPVQQQPNVWYSLLH